MSIKLAHQTQKTAGIPNGMRTATIAAVSSTAITLSVNGGQFSNGVGVITSYAPRVGDTVAVFRQDSSWLILGPTSAVNGWNLMTTLGYQNGWADRGSGFGKGQYRITSTEVQLVGEISNAGIPSSGQLIVAGLPSPPAEVVMLGAMAAVNVRMVVSSSGNLTIFDATAAGNLQFSCSYPLDFQVA